MSTTAVISRGAAAGRFAEGCRRHRGRVYPRVTRLADATKGPPMADFRSNWTLRHTANLATLTAIGITGALAHRRDIVTSAVYVLAAWALVSLAAGAIDAGIGYWAQTRRRLADRRARARFTAELAYRLDKAGRYDANLRA